MVIDHPSPKNSSVYPTILKTHSTSGKPNCVLRGVAWALPKHIHGWSEQGVQHWIRKCMRINMQTMPFGLAGTAVSHACCTAYRDAFPLLSRQGIGQAPFSIQHRQQPLRQQFCRGTPRHNYSDFSWRDDAEAQPPVSKLQKLRAITG